VDSFDYLPDGAGPYGYAPDGSYPYSARAWPADGWAATGRPQHGRPSRGYPPRREPAPPYSASQYSASRYRASQYSASQYSASPYRPGQYSPYGAGSWPPYVPGPQAPPAYDARAFWPHAGRSAYQDAPRYGQQSAATTLLAPAPAGSGPVPGYRPSGGMITIEDLLPDSEPARTGAMTGGKTRSILGWLPFGHRIVLLPREDAEDGEQPREHRDVNGGWLRPAVFGAMDGLVTNSSLIAGIGAGGGGHAMIVLTGIAGLIAGAFSMATGEYISVTSQNELTVAEVELEARQHARDRGAKRARLAEIYMAKGVSPNLAEAVARQISADPERAIATHVREDLGIDPDDLPSARTAAVASLASFTVGALIPLAPFLAGFPNLTAALVLAGASAFAGGAAVAKLTGRSPLLGGLRQVTAAFLATGMALLVGHLIGGHVS